MFLPLAAEAVEVLLVDEVLDRDVDRQVPAGLVDGLVDERVLENAVQDHVEQVPRNDGLFLLVLMDEELRFVKQEPAVRGEIQRPRHWHEVEHRGVEIAHVHDDGTAGQDDDASGDPVEPRLFFGHLGLLKFFRHPSSLPFLVPKGVYNSNSSVGSADMPLLWRWFMRTALAFTLPFLLA